MQQRDKDAKEQARLDLEYYRECLAKEDRQFLDYAAEVIEDRKLKGRPVAVIERVTEVLKDPFFVSFSIYLIYVFLGL